VFAGCLWHRWFIKGPADFFRKNRSRRKFSEIKKIKPQPARPIPTRQKAIFYRVDRPCPWPGWVNKRFRLWRESATMPLVCLGDRTI